MGEGTLASGQVQWMCMRQGDLVDDSRMRSRIHQR